MTVTRHQQSPSPDLQLPSLPELTLRALEACRGEQSYRQIGEIVASDTAMAARVLALANSALYGRPGEIRSVEQALLRLGTDCVHSLILTVALRQLLFNLGADQWGQLRDFWRHSLTTALTARALATLTRYNDPDEAFLLGMLHNIGELIALKTEDEHLKQQYLDQQAEIGANLTESWGLGPMAADAMRYQQASPADIQDASHLVKLINLSTRLALSDAAGIAAAIRVFDLSEELTHEIRLRIDREVEALAQTLSIPLREHYDAEPGQQRLRHSLISQALTNEALSLAQQPDIPSILAHAVSGLTLLTGMPCLSFGAGDDGLTLMATSQGDLASMVVASTPAHSVLTKAFAGSGPVTLEDDAPTVLDRQLLNLLGTPSFCALPVQAGSDAVGVLVLGTNSNEDPSRDLADMYARQLSQNVSRALREHQDSDLERSTEHNELRRQLHEVSNPLTIVRQYIYQLRNKMEDPGVQGDLDVIREELERATNLLLQVGRHSPEDQEFDRILLNDELKPLADLFEETLFANGHTSLNLNLCRTPTWISGSRGSIRQLVINLVKNAVEAMPAGGDVTLRTTAPVIQSGSQWVELVIQDSGPGLPANVQHQLFRPVETTKGSHHSGLGLSIVKQLIDGMEGIISCHTGDTGTLFRILFPMTADDDTDTHR
ncbi:HDOD domain-containing protein [Marinobacter zhejiangensis]|uniref:histidine kinase n=1 Tax=Marinobacter zhejiangensis TaxID=488535 RepID=A0A1I4NAC2_9GAMM|nr:HDOD domain-containing protein [Marinobacter zhejiangensis]SFM12512.1 HD-like signal output (HDOD) domain, no enzymatic activity [Marinobacter zhejiangensis]